MDRISWSDYFMSLCFLAAQRSSDPDTRHGCLAVADDRTILSTGYNGPPRNCIDSSVPLTRPLKYKWHTHSESNAITNAARHGISLMHSTFYITGFPCVDCFRQIINVGAKRIIYGPVGSSCIDENDMDIIKNMKRGQTIEIVPFYGTGVADALQRSLDYFNVRSKDNFFETAKKHFA